MSEAVGGYHLSTWETVAAFVTACGADTMTWRLKWEEAREAVDAAKAKLSSTEGEMAEPIPRKRSWTRRVIPYAVTVLVSAVIASMVMAAVTANRDNDSQRQSPPAGRNIVNAAVITVQNKVALGRDRLIEDTTPAYLSTKPEPFCASHGCKVSGTEVGSGAMLVAVCYVHGSEMFNYNLDASESTTNPNRVASRLWYRAVFPNGRAGYISEVYIQHADRGGLGLPTCR
jgi:hypothetical protein